MSASTGRPPRLTRDDRPDIILPNGEVAMPRARFAKDKLRVNERTVARMDLPTMYIGGVAHVLVNKSLEIVAAQAQRRNQPLVRRPTATAPKKRGHGAGARR